MPRPEGNVPWRIQPEPWEQFAACAGRGHEPWFDEDNPAVAKAVCATCPVLDPCRDFADRGGTSLYGTWAGLTRAERLAIRRQRRQLEQESA